MSNLTNARRQLFGFSPPLPRAAKPYDRFSKLALWNRVQALEAQLVKAHGMASTLAREAHNDRRHAERDRLHEVGRAAELVRPLAMELGDK